LWFFQLAEDEVVAIPDITNSAGMVFSDGCGLMSPMLAREVVEKLKEYGHDLEEIPSVFQVGGTLVKLQCGRRSCVCIHADSPWGFERHSCLGQHITGAPPLLSTIDEEIRV